MAAIEGPGENGEVRAGDERLTEDQDRELQQTALAGAQALGWGP